MENEVLNVIKTILESRYKEIQDKIKELKDEQMELDKQKSEMRKQEVEKKQFSFFDKVLFKRKEYQDYLDGIKKHNQEINDKSSEIRQKQISIDDQIYEQNNKLTKLEWIIEKPHLIELSTISNYFKDYQEIEEFCNKKNIKLTNAQKLYLGKDSSDKEFMNDAISEDFRLIKFDNSYSPELYKKVIDQLNEFAKNNVDASSYKYNINLYEKLTSGKYDDHFIKHVMDYIKYICAKGDTLENMKLVIIKYYLNFTRTLDRLYQNYQKENFGKVLEKLYEDDDYVIGCHGTDYKPNGDIIEDDKIFENGVRESNRSNSKSMQFTVAYNIPFLEVLDYDQNRYGDVSGGTVYILKIPKDVVMQKEPLWGVGEDGKCYVLPEFVYGKYKQKTDNPEVILNTNSNKKIYDNKELDRSKI